VKLIALCTTENDASRIDAAPTRRAEHACRKRGGIRIEPQHESRTDGEWMDPDRIRFRVDGTVRSECNWLNGCVRRADDDSPIDFYALGLWFDGYELSEGDGPCRAVPPPRFFIWNVLSKYGRNLSTIFLSVYTDEEIWCMSWLLI